MLEVPFTNRDDHNIDRIVLRTCRQWKQLPSVESSRRHHRVERVAALVYISSHISHTRISYMDSSRSYNQVIHCSELYVMCIFDSFARFFQTIWNPFGWRYRIGVVSRKWSTWCAWNRTTRTNTNRTHFILHTARWLRGFLLSHIHITWGRTTRRRRLNVKS